MKLTQCFKDGKLKVLLALYFAASMLILAWVFRGQGHREVIFMQMVGGYFVAASLIERKIKELPHGHD